MALITDIKNIVIEHLDLFRSNEGKSKDAYHENIIYHPMSEGKYLLALSSLQRAGYIKDEEFDAYIYQSVARLQRNKIKLSGRKLGFGLGFSYKETQKDEPFIITTSIVLDGLLSCYRKELNNKGLSDLIERILGWLLDIERLSRTELPYGSLPVFSPNNKIIVFNAIAYWAHVIRKAQNLHFIEHDEMPDRIAECLGEVYAPGVGWVYKVGDSRIDLIHQCYILNSLSTFFPASRIERKAMETLSRFVTSDGILDKYDIVSIDQAIDIIVKTGSVFSHIDSEKGFIYHRNKARLWSFGEMLVLLSWLARQGQNREYWTVLMRRYSLEAIDILDSNIGETKYFRQTMHLMHGLSSVMAVLRMQVLESQ